MRRLLISLVALCLGVVVGCKHSHMAGVCDCGGRDGYHGQTMVLDSASAPLPNHREMPKAK